MVLLVVVAGAAAAGCQAAPPPAAGQAPQAQVAALTSVSRPGVPLGTSQEVRVANAFGPGRGDVTARLTVFAVRDHVAAGVRPRALASHWASADVRVCRTAAVVLGFPAWVLGDDDGRTAQVAAQEQPGFPQPALPTGAGGAACVRGWVTFVTADDLHPTRVTFEQTRAVPAPWRPSLRAGAR